MRRLWRENSLSIVFLALFAGAVAGQAIAGWHEYNEQARVDGEATLALGRFLTSSSFANAVLENWQSEYLQFTLYILLTVWFVQKGSPESKEPGQEGPESDEEQLVGPHATARSPAWARASGARLWLFSNSLVLAMAAIWLTSWFAQSVTGWSEHNAERITDDRAPLSWLEYVRGSTFWQATFENWQSEFLAVGSMAVLAVYLRQRGSPESKKVGAPHEATGMQG
jgi:hypothetical protein